MKLRHFILNKIKESETNCIYIVNTRDVKEWIAEHKALKKDEKENGSIGFIFVKKDEK
jgi:hypothetical protein